MRRLAVRPHSPREMRTDERDICAFVGGHGFALPFGTGSNWRLKSESLGLVERRRRAIRE